MIVTDMISNRRMTIYLSKPSGISFYSLRAPLQVIAGDFDETPHYGEHISSSISPVLVAVEDSLPDYV